MENKREEGIIAAKLRKRGFRVEAFSKAEKQESKTPDFRVIENSKLAFFCEVKAVVEDKWIEEAVNKSADGEIVVLRRGGTVHDRISNKIHESYSQFDAVNSSRLVPNILAFVNNDVQCSAGLLIQVLTGNFFADDGKSYPIFMKYSAGRIKDEVDRIDGFIWLDILADDPEIENRARLFLRSDSAHLHDLGDYFKLRIAPIKSERALLPYFI